LAPSKSNRISSHSPTKDVPCAAFQKNRKKKKRTPCVDSVVDRLSFRGPGTRALVLFPLKNPYS
jgi:hypothetical protein